MSNSEYPLDLKRDYFCASANDLIKGKQKMTLREAQLLFIAISQVVKDDTNFKTYTTTIPELADFMGIDKGSLYRDIEHICSNLLQRVVKIRMNGETEKSKQKWEAFHWVDKILFDKGKLTIRLSDDLKPYLIDLDRYYSQTLLGTLLTFRSYYATRLYQYLKADHGAKNGRIEEWTFSCEELRELFQVEEKDRDGKYKKYKLNRDLIRKTIIPALDELNSSDFVHVWDYSEQTVSKGRGKPTLVGVTFKAMLFDNKERKEFHLNISKPIIEEINKMKLSQTEKEDNHTEENTVEQMDGQLMF